MNGSKHNQSDVGATAVLSSDEAEAAIERFCQIIQFPTVSSLAVESGAYRDCADWLVQQCKAIEVFDDVWILPESPDHSPVVVAKWIGQNPTLPILLLNSHYDVVPAVESEWTVPPFDGYRQNGNIYGRGTQDMKCVCIQYIEAIRKIHSTNPDWKPYRSIYLTFVPDEEVGGSGMAAFLDSKLYKEELPGIALALDEGLASTTDQYSVFYGERLPWWIDVTVTGPTGHGSRFIENTAVEQLIDLANRAFEFREGQRKLIGLTKEHNCSHAVAAAAAAASAAASSSTTTTLGDVTSLNITMIEAGVRVGNTYAYNCVPPKARCVMDIRISPNTPPSDVSTMLDQWCQECSRNEDISKVKWSFLDGSSNNAEQHATTSIDPIVNPWYKTFANAVERCSNSTVVPQVFPAATDSRFLRALGIRALGFTPLRLTEIMLHENNEYIPESRFLEGIAVYHFLIQELGSFTEPDEQSQAT